MRLTKTFLGLLLVLLGPPAWAQIGSPGISNPPATVSAGLPIALEAGATISGTAETILFKLDGDSAATQTFLSFTNVATPANVITMAQDSTTPKLTTSLLASGGRFVTDELSPLARIVTFGGGTEQYADQLDVAGATYSETLSGVGTVSRSWDATASANMQTTVQNGSGNSIDVVQDSAIPSLTTTVTDGTNVVTHTLNGGDPSVTTLVTNGATGTAQVAQSVSGGAGAANMSAGNGTASASVGVDGTGAVIISGDNGTTSSAVSVDSNGLLLPTRLFADLGTPADGYILYCSDCTIAAVCVGAGTGALAKRLGGVWVCN